MLIFNINGGLGNQMFQYAFGLYISEKYKREVSFDVEDLNNNRLRNLELDSFQLKIPLASRSQIRKFKKSKYARINYYINKLLFQGRNYFYEPKINDSIINEGDSYYWGYWQKPQSIIEIDDKIRKLFILKEPLNPEAKLYEEKIKTTNGESVSIHIRKTDYLHKKNDYFAICDSQYYFNSIDIIELSRKTDLHFFVFSDDFSWVKSNINFHKIDHTFVDSKIRNRAAEDLYLMSLCNHNIIANSTFSWWAAYLNNHQNKIVVSPKFWFKDHTRKNINLEDWIEIENG